MRQLGMNKRGLHWDIIVMVIIGLIVLVILVFFSGQISKWVNQIIDKLFGW